MDIFQRAAADVKTVAALLGVIRRYDIDDVKKAGKTSHVPGWGGARRLLPLPVEWFAFLAGLLYNSTVSGRCRALYGKAASGYNDSG